MSEKREWRENGEERERKMERNNVKKEWVRRENLLKKDDLELELLL